MLGFPHGIKVGSITTAAKPKGSVKEVEVNAAEAMAALGWLRPMRPDLICFPEAFLYAGMQFARAEEVALEPHSPIIRRFAELAEACKTSLAIPFLELADDGQIYNAVILYGPNGVDRGTYRKQVLWPSDQSFSQFEKGVVPGGGGGPFQTEFGLVGIQTCLEMHWPTQWKSLGAAGVKIIAFPSEQSGGLVLTHRAWDARCFILSAASKGGPSHVIDPLGNVLSTWWPGSTLPLICIPFDFELVHLDYSEEKLRSIASSSSGVRVDFHYPERVGLVWSENKEVKVEDVLAENGLLTLDQYLTAIDIAHGVLPSSANVIKQP